LPSPPLLEVVLALFRNQAQERRISLALEIGSPLGELMADRVRLQQILHNLLSNAIKFTPEGGLITLTARQIGLEQELFVRDTGSSIPPEERAVLTQQAVQFVGEYGTVTLSRLLEDLRRISFLAN
jgi:cell cycle sensor histidine kinase DivJ